MDLEPEFNKLFQIRLNSYCITQKPFLSLDFGISNQISSTNFELNSRFFRQRKEEVWNKSFLIETSKSRYPTLSISMIPFNYFKFNIFDNYYYLHFSPDKYSLFLKFDQEDVIKYGLTYKIKPTPSIIGCFSKNDYHFLSVNFSEKRCSMFYKINDKPQEYFFIGLKMTNRQTFFTSFDEFVVGAQEKIFDGLFSIGYSFPEPFRIAFSRRKNNYRLTYILKDQFVGYDFVFNHYFQYKYVNDKKRKLGFMYDFSEKNLYMRGSFRLFNYIKIKSSVKYDGSFFDPTIGFSINFS